MTSKTSPEQFLREAEREVGRFAWEGTFAEYLEMLVENPAISRLSHKLVYDAILAKGVRESPETGAPRYRLFDEQVYGQDDTIESVVEYFASSADRLEIRKRILLLLGPPASGKSTIAALIKEALQDFTRTDAGAVYAIKGCPMQEDPLHLIPHNMRRRLMDEYGLYAEGDLCPRCRYEVRARHGGKIADVPVARVVFSEQEAVGIGYYVATSNPSDASLLVGSVDTSQLEGDRLEVAGKAFRLDGELNVANRGLMEFVEIFKVEPRLLTTLLGLAQEQLIKMDRFGSVYADEVVIGHSNEGDFRAFLADPSSEALRDRIMRIHVPYNLRVSDEVLIYEKMLVSSGLGGVHFPPLTLPAISAFAVMSRMRPPAKQSVPIIDKLRAYDGEEVDSFSREDLLREKRAHPNEGMSGVSPRSVMNRLSARAATPDLRCISPLNALDSVWRGRDENVSLTEEESARYIEHVREAINDYNDRAIRHIQIAFKERFEQTAAVLLSDYLSQVDDAFHAGTLSRASRESERVMRGMERPVGISEREKGEFRREIYDFFQDLRTRDVGFDYTSEPRIRASVERQQFPDHKTLRSELEPPRSSGRQAEWRWRRGAVCNRLIEKYGYCGVCADDTVEYVLFLLNGGEAFRVARNENEIEWRWTLNPPGGGD